MTEEKEKAKSGVSRRDFLTGTVGGVVAGAAVAAATGSLGLPRTVTAEQPSTPPAWDFTTDVVVAGAGVGGLTAALSARQAGANVVCVEAYSQVGGTADDSGGGAVAPATLAAAQAQMPYGDPAFLSVFVNTMPNAAALMKSTDVPGIFSATGYSAYSSAPATYAKILAFYQAVAQYFTNNGGTLLLNTKAVQLYTGANGAVSGVQVTTGPTSTLTQNWGYVSDWASIQARGYANIQTKAVVLATGGFQNNPEMKTRYFGPFGSMTLARSVPTNDGTGILMAQAIGAKLSPSLGTFYGHTLPAPPAVVNFGELSNGGGSQFYEVFAILVNLDGLRFTDESTVPPGVYGDLTNQDLTWQRNARGCVIFDQSIYNNYGYGSPGEGWPTSVFKGTDRIALAKSAGGHVASANTLQDLATAISAWGYNGYQMVQTVTQFNAAVAAGTTANLVPPKTPGSFSSIAPYVNAITTPPFWAVEVCPGISCCYGGLAIDTSTRVLKQDNTPIPGLYATVGAAGGITAVNYYLSSQGACSAFGYLAGQNAAAYAMNT